MAIRKYLQILLYDENFNRKHEFKSWITSPSWEYWRVGGCGQCQISVLRDADDYELLFKPRTSIRILVDGQLRYQGRILKLNRLIKSGSEILSAVFYGYISQLSKIIVRDLYENMEVSAIVKDILDNYVIENSDITYDDADIQVGSYTVAAIDFNHTVKDAFALLGQLGGNIEWGVDRNRKFFFKQTDKVVRRAYLIGREIANVTEERSNEEVINKLNVFGSNGYITTVQSSISIQIFGTNESNRFESSIIEAADANQLGAVSLKQLSKIQRKVQFDYLVDDKLIEGSTPLGATAISKSNVPRLHKYATFKYGSGIKYGNFTQDQINLIRYSLKGSGLQIQMTLEDQIPSLATQQKQIEYQLKDLQRR